MTTMLDVLQPVPCQVTRSFTTHVDNQTTVTIAVFEGERPYTKDCALLAKINFTGIPPMPRGTPRIAITLEVCDDNFIYVSAMERLSGYRMKRTLVAAACSSRLTYADILHLRGEAELLKVEDAIAKLEIATAKQLIAALLTREEEKEKRVDARGTDARGTKKIHRSVVNTEFKTEPGAGV
jgi:molecular chaperone DnaK